ncbi:MAG TPA: hypothetical protein VIG28_03385 [Leifsonia sp.]
MVVNGLPVCAPAQVWVQLGGRLAAEELVAIGDHIVGARRRVALATIEDLAEEAAQSGTAKGAAALRWAAGRIRWGADSRPESLLRLAIVREGLPEPLVNQPVSLADGAVIHPDLVFVESRVALEYEGDGHRTDAVQWHRDIRRYEQMVSSGWGVLRVTSRDLFTDRAQLMLRVRNAIRSCEKRA